MKFNRTPSVAIWIDWTYSINSVWKDKQKPSHEVQGTVCESPCVDWDKDKGISETLSIPRTTVASVTEMVEVWHNLEPSCSLQFEHLGKKDLGHEDHGVTSKEFQKTCAGMEEPVWCTTSLQHSINHTFNSRMERWEPLLSKWCMKL